MARTMKKLVLLLLVAFPVSLAFANANLPDEDKSIPKPKDDSDLIVSRIKEAIPKGGIISIEQGSGRLLFNPSLERLFTAAPKQKFLMPAIVIDQHEGLKLVKEMPFSCFLITGGELASDEYSSYRQHATVLYIRDVKNFPVARALICQTMGMSTTNWRKTLNLDENSDPFIFDEHVNRQGEHFFYYINSEGSFEMYM